MQITFSLEEITSIANRLLQVLEGRKCLAFHGEMGAGKTTLISVICAQLGVEEVTGSPTFSIINEYRTNQGDTVFHMDLYRLKDEAEAIQAGVEDCLYSGHYCLVEWPEKAPGIFPPDTAHVHISTVDADLRNIRLML